MRLTNKKIVQTGFVFACLVFLNCIYLVLIRPSQNSFTLTKKEGDPPGLQHGDHHILPFLANGLEKGIKLRENSGRGWSIINWFEVPKDILVISEQESTGFKPKLDHRKLLTGQEESLKLPNNRLGTDPPATSVHRKTELDDIYISVKTSGKFHEERLGIILDTWWMLARDQTYFFTDTDDPLLQERTRGHFINTKCSSSHGRSSLCCKMSVEYDTFITSGKRWFCHVDDDTYLNVPALVSLLRGYNHTGDWYLGKPSLNHPLKKRDINNKLQTTLFWFATGGAGFCISRALALKMMPFTAGGKFQTVCQKIRLPDDCTIGFIIYYYVKKELTVVKSFHSHLEGLWAIRQQNLDSQITFSYHTNRGQNMRPNVINVSLFNETEDPTRFKSIHCILYPNMKGCPNTNNYGR